MASTDRPPPRPPLPPVLLVVLALGAACGDDAAPGAGRDGSPASGDAAAGPDGAPSAPGDAAPDAASPLGDASSGGDSGSVTDADSDPDTGPSCPPAVHDGPPLAALAACGRLSYGRYANRDSSEAIHVLPDFSFAGYRGGGVALPDVAVVETVMPGSGDDRARIQAAIDAVASRPADAGGHRGAVLLTRGRYEVGDTLRITVGGVVLRGEGQGEDGTVLVATAARQHTLIELAGAGSPAEVGGTRTRIATALAPVGARTLELADAAGFAPGDLVAVLRTPNDAWIDALGTGPYGWTAATYAVAHPRTVVALEGRSLMLDIPLVDAIDEAYGGGAVYALRDRGTIRECGVEDLRLESSYAGDTDEDHGWVAVSLADVDSSWVRRVTTRWFGYSAVALEDGASFNTVEEVACLDPISQISGGRRYPFAVNGGIGNLFQRCFARNGRHNFVTGSRVTGPHVWLDCLAVDNHADDGPHHRWATGLLFDNTRSSELHVQNRQDSGTGHGWAGAQVLFWNAEADELVCDAPPGAMSWAVGCVGDRAEGSWAPEEPPGIFESHGAPVEPRSLYLQQLRDRLGAGAVEATTTPAQRAGRLWDALGSWAGEGRLPAAP